MGKLELIIFILILIGVIIYGSYLLYESITKRIVDSFDLIDVKYDGPFEKSVERKQVAVQDAITAQNKTVQITEEANQAKIKAQGEAEALAITATALRNDPTLIEYKKIQAWQATGGKVPNTVVGNASPPFINLGSK